MSREDVVAVAVRLFAIYVVFTILRTSPAAAQFLSSNDGVVWASVFIAVLVICALICAFLWFFPLSIARKLLPAMREPRSEQAVGERVALSLGLTLIGVWFFASALTDATYWLVLVIRSKQLKDIPMEWTDKQIASMAEVAVQLLLSVWLIFGSAGIRRIVYKFRYGASGASES